MERLIQTTSISSSMIGSNRDSRDSSNHSRASNKRSISNSINPIQWKRQVHRSSLLRAAYTQPYSDEGLVWTMTMAAYTQPYSDEGLVWTMTMTAYTQPYSDEGLVWTMTMTAYTQHAHGSTCTHPLLVCLQHGAIYA